MNKYPLLQGVCKQAIKNNLCTGCQKLEDINFIGVQSCKYLANSREHIKEVLGGKKDANKKE